MKAVVIGVAGGSASGKSTVVRRIVEALGRDSTSVIAHDRYYRDHTSLSAAARAALNYDHPDALETDLLTRHVQALRAGHAVDVPIYDFVRHARAEGSDRIQPRPRILVEGILVLADAKLRALLDLKVFVATDDDARLERRLRRDVAKRGRTVESVVAQHRATVQPMHAAFVEPSRCYADIIVRGGGDDTAAIQAIVAKIEALGTNS